MKEQEVRFVNNSCDDADIVIVAYGSVARICRKVAQLAREEGIKVGVIRPITLFPFPTVELQRLAAMGKKFISVELSAGQMVEDVRLAVGNDVQFYGRTGGIVPTPEEILEQIKKMV